MAGRGRLPENCKNPGGDMGARAEQRRQEFVCFYAEREPASRLHEVIKGFGISVKTYYNWMRIPAFRAEIEYADAVRRQFSTDLIRRHQSEVVDAMVKKAIDGDVRAARLVLECEGLLSKRPVDNFVQSQIQLQETQRRRPETIAEALELEERSRKQLDRFKELYADEMEEAESDHEPG